MISVGGAHLLGIKMYALILAGGYGTRLARDLETHGTEYPHLVGLPKPLLPVAGLPLISHWVNMLEACSKVTCVCVVVSDIIHVASGRWIVLLSNVRLIMHMHK